MNAGAALAVLAVALAVAIGVVFPDRSAEMEAERYCRMVWAHHRDPAYGWPDFHHVYAEQCREDGAVNEEYLRGR